MSGCTVCAGTGENLTGAICHGCHGTGRAPAPQAVKVAAGGAPPLTPEGFIDGIGWTYAVRAPDDGMLLAGGVFPTRSEAEAAQGRLRERDYEVGTIVAVALPGRAPAPQAQARTPSAASAASAPEGKDCPFCGHETAIENLRSSSPVYPIAMRIRCSDCGASAAVAMGTDHDAVLLKAWSMWDRRFTQPHEMGYALTCAERERDNLRESWIAARHVVFAAREVCSAWPADLDFGKPGTSIGNLRDVVTAYDQRNHDRAGVATSDGANAPSPPEEMPSSAQSTSDEEIALELATWLRGVVHDTPGAVDREIALARAVWLEEIANRARAYVPLAAGWITLYRATAERAADHLDAEADCLRESHTISGAWPEAADEATREAKADHDSMRACAVALRAKP